MQGLGAPSCDPVAQHGRVYAKLCSSCSGTKRIPTKRGDQVCHLCGALWAFEDCFSLKGEFQFSRRSGSSEDHLFPWIDIGRIISALESDYKTRWPMRIYADRVLGEYTLRELAAAASRNYRAARFPWNKDRVVVLILEGRMLFSQRLAAAGLLSESIDSLSDKGLLSAATSTSFLRRSL
jgi:hypothetical protein